MKLIQTITLTSNAASVEFASIPQTFTDLVFVASARTVAAAIQSDLGIAIGTSNFRTLQGDGSTAASQSTTGYINIGTATGDSTTADTFGNSTCYIPNYTGATAKSFSADGVAENDATAGFQRISAGLSTTTSPITTLTIGSGADYVSGSTFSLYGITKGSDGIVTTS
jgi:hypothetical protein